MCDRRGSEDGYVGCSVSSEIKILDEKTPRNHSIDKNQRLPRGHFILDLESFSPYTAAELIGAGAKNPERGTWIEAVLSRGTMRPDSVARARLDPKA